jgi:PAS domain S-box-containing protein/putative nucleotidyltransferase with HDIG domain
MKFPKINIELWISLIYLTFGALWIFFSDKILAAFTSDSHLLTEIQTYKGWAYVAVSALLIYSLLKRFLSLQRKSDAVARENIERYHLLFNSSLNAVLLTTSEGNILAANPAACRIFEYSEREFCRINQKNIIDMTDPHFSKLIEEYEQTGSCFGELTFLRKDGSKFPGEISLSLFHDHAGRNWTSIFIHDISDRKQAERNILRLNRLYATLSQINQSIVREKTHDDLFKEICRVTVEHGKFAMAWIGLIDENEHKLKPVTFAGNEQGFLNNFNVDYLKTENYINPISKAIREKKCVICQDIEFLCQTPRRKLAVQLGFKSSAVVPFQLHNRVIGVLVVFSSEIQGFDEDDEKLLIEIGADISYALDIMAIEEKRRLSEEALRRSETNLKKAQVAANVGSWMWHIPTNRVEWSDQMYRIFNIDKETFTGDLAAVIDQAIHPDDREKVNVANAAVIEQGKPYPVEYRIVRGDGTERTVWAEAGELIVNELGEPVLLSGYVQDITEIKANEKILRENEARLKLALSSSKQGVFDINVQTGEGIVDDVYASMLGYDPATFVDTGARWLGRMHPEDQERVNQHFQACMNGNVPEYRVEYRQQTASGEWKWFLSAGSIVEYDQNQRPLRMIGIQIDIDERKKSELEIARLLAESQRRLERIETLHAIDIAISSNLDLKQTLDVILHEAKNHLLVDAAVVLLFDEENRTFKHADSLGFHTDLIQRAQVRIGDSLVGKLAKWEDIAVFNREDYYGFDPFFIQVLEEEGFNKYIGISLFSKGKLIGVLELFNRFDLDIDDEWRNFFKTLAGQAGVAIENARLVNGLQIANLELLQAYDATILGWSMAMDFRDKETEGHTQRVTELTLALARKLGIPEDQMEHIRRGALLHDIGKMGIPDAILLKPGLLTNEERIIMQTHPKMAYDMLKSIDFLRPALEIPHLHHEKWDGSGYPYGLKGEEIPLPARLFAVIDVFDALTSDRPYRPAWSKEKTLTYIQEQSGKHFDPEVVKQFLSLV